MNLVCYVCGSTDFRFAEVLWPELIEEWQISDHEADYINRQQGLCCRKCGSNLRSIALARAILVSYGFPEYFMHFPESKVASGLRVLEINQAGTLTPYLERLPLYKLVTYPEFDMTNLGLGTGDFDMVVHSDTLEHIKSPEAGLSECRRVLSDVGRCFFTVPIIVDRLSKSRMGLPSSYHGSECSKKKDLLVHQEFGADVWKYVFLSGFSFCCIHCLEYPSGLAIEARS